MAGSSGKDDVYGARNRSAHDLADVVETGHEKRRWRLPELRLVSGVWRAGIDLNPLDVADPDDVHWLSCLVWPGEGDRAERLAAAIELARQDPPPLVRGDLVDRLAARERPEQPPPPRAP